MKNNILYIVVPCYNEEEVIKIFYAEIQKIKKDFKNVTFEIIFVNDGSKDNTLEEAKEFIKILKDRAFDGAHSRKSRLLAKIHFVLVGELNSFVNLIRSQLFVQF